MNRAVAVMAVGILFTGAIGLAQAAGNPQAGKNKTAPCAGCHGADGNSIAPIFPKLAGQHASYLAKQLRDFKSHSRSDQSMEAMAATLSEQDIEDISDFYAGQSVSSPAGSKERYLDQEQSIEITDTLRERGRTLYLNGNADSGVPSCSGCHGPTGSGNAPAGFPALNGQFGAYITKTLSDYKAGARANDPEATMRTIAKRMTTEEIHAVSAYVSKIDQ